MLLNIKKRLLLISYLPKEGSLAEQLICKDISDKVKVKKDEMDAVGIPNEDGVIKPDQNGNFSWDHTKEVDFVVDFTNAEIGILKGIVEKLDAEKKVNIDNIDLCVDIKNI